MDYAGSGVVGCEESGVDSSKVVDGIREAGDLVRIGMAEREREGVRAKGGADVGRQGRKKILYHQEHLANSVVFPEERRNMSS